MGRLSNFLLCGWRLLFSISAPGRGSGKPPCKQRYAPTWLWGLDAPTTARTVGLPPRRGEYFLSKRKKVPKKACGTALREKGIYCPFWRRGSLCRAQHGWPAFTCDPARSELAFFRHQNGRAFFPPLPIAARLRRRLGGGEGQRARVGMIRRGAVDLARQTAKGDPNHVGL